MTTQTLPIYQVDAFTDVLFAGNPAAVVPLQEWLPDDVMQKIAMENNLSETAFFVPTQVGDTDFHIRWFTPTVEVPLCGHATLASAFVIFNRLGFAGDLIRLHSQSGTLTAQRDGTSIILDFPRQPIKPDVISDDLVAILGKNPIHTYRVVSRETDIVAVYDNAKDVRDMNPDMGDLARLTKRGVIVTAPGDKTGLDMVSRYFLPASGINEDPVTGYMHCVVGPYWAEQIGKTQVVGYQASQRGGVVVCDIDKDRVRLKGEAILYLQGEIIAPAA
ncbi:PhzF family phenazine biosynthesis protein [Thalassospira sp. MA62]|nr:PhzF family phenazine biosynthesis protein [Thalassospira sp. MA62]